MTIAITCSCSAKLQVDDQFAGKSINCPDCGKPIDVPIAEGDLRTTSGWAIVSLICALVGAFTLVGTVLAVVLGVIALWSIRAHPKKLTGRGFALAGIVLGVVMTLFSLYALTASELFGVHSMLRRALWMGRLEYPDSLVIKKKDAKFSIERPSKSWGVFRGKGNDPDRPWLESEELLLVNPAKSAYIICLAEEVDAELPIGQCLEKAIGIFRKLEIQDSRLKRNPRLQVDLQRGDGRNWNVKNPPPMIRYSEKLIHKTHRGQKRTFYLRVIRRDVENNLGDTKMYIIAAGAPASQFAKVKKSLKKALDSFKILD